MRLVEVIPFIVVVVVFLNRPYIHQNEHLKNNNNNKK
jgi:hypothetical protein